MKKKITFLLMFVLSLSMVSAQGTFRFGTSATPEGKTLLVDSKGLILDGKHIIPVMGEIHYSRVPESEWRREIHIDENTQRCLYPYGRDHPHWGKRIQIPDTAAFPRK